MECQLIHLRLLVLEHINFLFEQVLYDLKNRFILELRCLFQEEHKLDLLKCKSALLVFEDLVHILDTALIEYILIILPLRCQQRILDVIPYCGNIHVIFFRKITDPHPGTSLSFDAFLLNYIKKL